MSSPERMDVEAEIVALRLIVRSLIAHLFATSATPLSKMIEEFGTAVDRTAVPLCDIDPALQKRGAALARRRADETVRSLGSILVTGRNNS